MKKHILYCIFLLIIILLINIFISNFYASETIEFTKYVFFDPITNGECNKDNYWTYYNQNTTCYRWIVLNVDGNNVRMILDHNVGFDTFNNASTILTNTTSNYKNVSKISMISEQEIKKALKLSEGPTIVNGSSTSLGGGKATGSGSVKYGEDSNDIVVTADEGYCTDKIIVDEKEISVVSCKSQTIEKFKNVKENHKVIAIFKKNKVSANPLIASLLKIAFLIILIGISAVLIINNKKLI